MFDDQYSPSAVRMERTNKPNKPKEGKKYLDPIGDAMENRKLYKIGFDRVTYEEAERLQLPHYGKPSL